MSELGISISWGEQKATERGTMENVVFINQVTREDFFLITFMVKSQNAEFETWA